MWHRLITIIAILSLHAEVAAADLENRIQACSSIDDPGSRLACYDDVAGALEGGTAERSVAGADRKVSPGTPRAASQPEATESFGKEHWQSQREVDTLESVVSAVEKDAYGKLVVRLDNGQIWRQVKVERVRIAVNDAVRIERGMLSSFFFVLPEGNRKVRFTRVE